MGKISYFLMGAAAALTVILIIFLINNKSSFLSENFSSKEQKADVIGRWWKDGGGSYNEFRRKIPGRVDIVDFFDSKNNNSKDITSILI